jgi:hypothetical protein
MPYIDQETRRELDTDINCLIERSPRKKGVVNYIITRIVLGVLRPPNGWGYETLSNAISVLHDAETELRRRLLDPYEDKAIARNGDVPEIELDA